MRKINALVLSSLTTVFLIGCGGGENSSNVNENIITFNGLQYEIITSPITGKKWLDRNLGQLKLVLLQQTVLVMEITINGEDWLMGMKK